MHSVRSWKHIPVLTCVWTAVVGMAMRVGLGMRLCLPSRITMCTLCPREVCPSRLWLTLSIVLCVCVCVCVCVAAVPVTNHRPQEAAQAHRRCGRVIPV